MDNKRYLVVGGILVILLATAYFLTYKKSEIPSPDTNVSASKETQEYLEKTIPYLEEVVYEGEEEFMQSVDEFPVYNSSTIDKTYTKTNDGWHLVHTVEDSVDDMSFWFEDEFDEEGWKITQLPEEGNEQYQSLSAEYPDGTIINAMFEKQGQYTVMTFDVIKQ